MTPSHAEGCSVQEILTKLELSLEEFESLPASVAGAGTNVNLPPELRFSIVRTLPDSVCSEFIGPKVSHGYGRLFISGKEWKAQRMAYALLVGPLPPGVRLLLPLFRERCIEGACCNSAHIKRQISFSGIVTAKRRSSEGHTINSLNSLIERRGGRIYVRCRICEQAVWRESKKTVN